MKKDKSETMFKVLILLVLVLGLLVLYAFILKPVITGYNVKMQTQAVNMVLTSIVTQIQQQGFVQIPLGNQTLILVPYQPEQQDQVNLVG